MSGVSTRSKNKRSQSSDDDEQRSDENMSASAPKKALSKYTFNRVVAHNNRNVSDDDKYRSEFDYVLSNIERSHRFNRLELIKEHEFDTDLTTGLKFCRKRTKNNSKLDFVSQLMDENESQSDMNAMLTRGEKDINNLAKISEIIDSISLNKIKSIKELDFDRICLAIYSNAGKLSSLMSDSSLHSFYRGVYEKYGYPGIAANISTSLFEKWQIFYILGCLNGLFESKLRSKLFVVVFPETLIRIIMQVYKLSYEQALTRVKPSVSDDEC